MGRAGSAHCTLQDTTGPGAYGRAGVYKRWSEGPAGLCGGWSNIRQGWNATASPHSLYFQAVPLHRLRQIPLYIQRSMKDTQDVNVIVCDNVGNSVMAIKRESRGALQIISSFAIETDSKGLRLCLTHLHSRSDKPRANLPKPPTFERSKGQCRIMSTYVAVAHQQYPAPRTTTSPFINHK